MKMMATIGHHLHFSYESMIEMDLVEFVFFAKECVE